MRLIGKMLKIFVAVGVIGILYSSYLLKGMPDVFDWEDESDEEDF